MKPNPFQRVALLTIALGWVLAVSGLCLPAAIAQSKKLTASELLDEFAETQDRLKSFIAQYEWRRDKSASQQCGKSRWYLAGETRFDGRRVSARSRLWGRITPDTVRTKEKPYYKSRSFDGQWRWQYDQPFWRADEAPRGQFGTLMLRRVTSPPRGPIELLNFCESTLIHCLGVLPHDGGKRFDARMRSVASVRVRDQLESAGWEPSPCYVLEAKTPHGQYPIWLDPAHGFQMAKAILRRQAGHQRANGYTLTREESDVSRVDKVRFAKSGDVWVPVEAAGGLDNVFAGGTRSSFRFHLQVTKFLLNPDHEALGSFVPDDIRNGAKVYYPDPEKRPPGVWQDGRAVDMEGRIILGLR